LVETGLLAAARPLDPSGQAEITLVHGGAPGADYLAGEVASALGWQVEVHPAHWGLYGKAAGPLRNQRMVDLGADICVAFPIATSRGTYDCMKRARSAGIPVTVYDEEEA